MSVSTTIMKTLHEREWVRVVGHRDVPGRPAMYATTRQFLDYFNLKSLEELPPLSELRNLDEFEDRLVAEAEQRLAHAANEPMDEGDEEADDGFDAPYEAEAYADESAADAVFEAETAIETADDQPDDDDADVYVERRDDQGADRDDVELAVEDEERI